MIPTIVPNNDAIMHIGVIAFGLILPYINLYDSIVVGIMVKPVVLSTKNVIILSDAVSELLFSSFNDFNAFIPAGVAALPKPNIFIIIFDEIYSNDLCDFGTSGNKKDNNGLNNLVNLVSNPDLDAIFMIPNHNAIKGNSPVMIVKVSDALLTIVLDITLEEPVNIENTMPIIINNPNIILIM